MADSDYILVVRIEGESDDRRYDFRTRDGRFAFQKMTSWVLKTHKVMHATSQTKAVALETETHA